MSIYFGNDTVKDLYVGLTPVSKGYVGTHLFYNGDNTIIDITYEKYILNTQFNTLYNTAEKPVKSAILKVNTDENLQSVKMPVLTTTGKNLFDEINGGFKEKNSINSTTGEITYFPSHFGVFQNYIPVKPNTTYTLSGQLTDGNNPVFRVAFYLKDTAFNKTVNKYVGNNGVGNRTSYNFTTSENDHYIRFSFGVMMQGYFQLEEGSTATEYEPYKSNILTVNEDVTLRSNGDVCDELNLLTGRLTQRIDENNEILSQEVVKTVDLSVVDQDGNSTKLSTFDDITYVTLSSEGLIPEAELEVATKNEEVLNTMSLEMDDISAAQTTLKETSNVQSENIDSTMIATTEIYEEIV